MELNYQYIDGKFERVKNSKVQKMNDAVSLKNFQAEIDKRIKKFEFIIQGSNFALATLRRIFIFFMLVFLLLASFLFSIFYFKYNPSAYQKLERSVFSQNSGSLLSPNQTTNIQANSLFSNQTEGLAEKERFFDCVVTNSTNTQTLACALKTVILYNKKEDSSNINMADGQTNIDLERKGAKILPNENLNQTQESEKIEVSFTNSTLNKPEVLQNDLISLLPAEKGKESLQTVLPREKTIEPAANSLSELQNNADKNLDKQKPQNKEANSAGNYEKEESIDYLKTSEGNNAKRKNTDKYSLTGNEQENPTKNRKQAQNSEFQISGENDYNLTKDSKKPVAKKEAPVYNNKKEVSRNSKHQTKSQNIDRNDYAKKSDQNEYDNDVDLYYEKHHGRKLQTILEKPTSDLNNSSLTSGEATAPRKVAGEDTQIEALELTETPIHLNDQVYFFSKPNFLQKLSVLQTILVICITFNLVSILTLVLLIKVVRKQIEAKLNELIVDMMIEENSQSDLFKFYIYGNYRFIDVKIENLDSSHSEKANLVLTNCEPYIDESQRGGYKRVSSITKGYFSVNEPHGNSKDLEEKRYFNADDKENIDYANRGL